MTALFIATEESKSKEAAIALIKANADVSLTIDGINIRQSLIKNFGLQILDYQPSDLDEAMTGLDIGNRSKLLRLLNESVIRNTLDEFNKELKMATAEDLNKSAPGAHNLIQVACEQGLPEHLQAMLNIKGTFCGPKNETLFIINHLIILFKVLMSMNAPMAQNLDCYWQLKWHMDQS